MLDVHSFVFMLIICFLTHFALSVNIDDLDPYRPFISLATETCIDGIKSDVGRGIKLEDRDFAPNVTVHELLREGASWRCGVLNCLDTKKGERGTDEWYIPDGADCNSPRVLYIHGGSFIIGHNNGSVHRSYVSHLAHSTGAIVLGLDVILAPVKFAPEITDYILKALEFLAHEVPMLNCKKSPAKSLFVGGDSSGATSSLTAAITQLKNQKYDFKLSGVFMWSGWYGLECNTADYYNKQLAELDSDLPFFNKSAYIGDLFFEQKAHASQIEFVLNALLYTGFNVTQLIDPIYSPINGDIEDFKGLPPLYFIVGGNEINLGDNLITAQKTAASGVNTHMEVYATMWHEFQQYSNGCSNWKNSPLWQGKTARKRMEEWLMYIHGHNGDPPCDVPSPGAPIHLWHYSKPNKDVEWFPTTLCGQKKSNI